MAFYDWNQNGKNDWQDDFLEYQIYNDFLQKRNSAGCSGGSADFGGTVLGLLIFVGVCFFIGCMV